MTKQIQYNERDTGIYNLKCLVGMESMRIAYEKQLKGKLL